MLFSTPRLFSTTNVKEWTDRRREISYSTINRGMLTAIKSIDRHNVFFRCYCCSNFSSSFFFHLFSAFEEILPNEIFTTVGELIKTKTVRSKQKQIN